MSTLPSSESLVQSLVPALMEVLGPVLREMSLSDLLERGDRLLRDAVLSAICLVMGKALSTEVRPANAVQKFPYRWHTACGLLQFTRFSVPDASGQVRDPVPEALVSHGCTVAIREQITVIHARIPTVETAHVLSLFLPDTPSVSTIHRVAVREGTRMAEEFTPALVATLLPPHVEPLAHKVSLIALGADGGHTPMRGDQSGDAGEWHEGRVVTVTLLGDPDPAKPRKVTLLDPPERTAVVGLERPVLASLTLAQMPTLDGPMDARIHGALMAAIQSLKELCPRAQWQGISDGGSWPESILAQAVGESRCTTDVMHASDHLHDAAKALFGDNEQSKRWWKEQRTGLLTEHGTAATLARKLRWYGARPSLCVDAAVVKTEAGYFSKRVHKMAYAAHLAKDECIASGHTEAGVKCAITVRMKRPGALWSHEGGDATLHARSLLLSELWDGAWADHIQRQFHPRPDVAA